MQTETIGAAVLDLVRARDAAAVLAARASQQTSALEIAVGPGSALRPWVGVTRNHGPAQP